MKWKKGLQTMTLTFAKFAWEVLVPVKNGRMFTLPRFVDCEFSCGHDAMHWWTQFLSRVTKNGDETSKVAQNCEFLTYFGPNKFKTNSKKQFYKVDNMQLFCKDATIFVIIIFFLPLKTWKNRSQKLLIIRPYFFFSIANWPKISPNHIFGYIKRVPCVTFMTLETSYNPIYFRNCNSLSIIFQIYLWANPSPNQVFVIGFWCCLKHYLNCLL